MFAYLCAENESATGAYLNTLTSRISSEETLSVRFYERPLLRLVQIGDKYQSERIKRVLQKLHGY